ncbi:ParB/RepB/Spo0J family partition protein [Nocardia sp. NPDC006044]|uniref:ParB/RepB/Spo0J family partition protein n=1 Tax=Nocardia sp. NPDC006044 TaxID=3364306 RepID=UPI0036D02D42
MAPGRRGGAAAAVVPEVFARMSSAPVEVVPIASILPGSSPRIDGLSPGHVRLLAETDEPLPPVIVHRPTMRIIDGAHRIQAALASGRKTIAIKYFEGSVEDAFVLAVQANVAHGLPLSIADRKRAAERLLTSHSGWSDRLIGRIAGLSHKTVGKLRRCSAGENSHLNGRLGQDGKVYRLELSEGRDRAADFIANHPGASLREIAKHAGISVTTAKRVRDTSCHSAAVPVGRTAARQSDTAGQAHAVPVQQLILRSLLNDPALKFTDAGKALLRRLAAGAADIRAWEQLAVQAPRHTWGALAQLARANARTWQELADRLENAGS